MKSKLGSVELIVASKCMLSAPLYERERHKVEERLLVQEENQWPKQTAYDADAEWLYVKVWEVWKAQ